MSGDKGAWVCRKCGAQTKSDELSKPCRQCGGKMHVREGSRKVPNSDLDQLLDILNPLPQHK